MANAVLMTTTTADAMWSAVLEDAERAAARDPLMRGLLDALVLRHERIDDALPEVFAHALGKELAGIPMATIAAEAMRADPSITAAARADIAAVVERDPACHRELEPLLYFKGFQGLLAYRVAHHLWNAERRDLALLLQSLISRKLTIDIHPAARLGRGVMIDHGHGVVIGQTAVVGDGVSILHGVTLGGNGKEDGDRHPKIGADVLIGARASILGNITVGRCSRVAAGSVVLQDVPPCKTVAGVPAKIVGDAGCNNPARNMDHRIEGCGGETD